MSRSASTAVSMRAIASVVPEARVKVAELAEAEGLTPPQRQVYDQLGIETIAVDDAATAADLAVRAASLALERAGIGATEVDALIEVQSRAPEKLMASEATRVQAAIGADRAITFGVSELGCVSISSALLVARALLHAHPGVDTVLVAHGSKPTGPRRYRHPVTINGDGGTAVVLTREGPNRIVDIALETNGEYWDLYHVDYKDTPVADWVEQCTSAKTYSFKLAIESRNRFVRLNEDLLARSGLTFENVDAFVMQNLSGGAFRFYEELFGVSFTPSCWDNLRRYGHLGSMDIPFNLGAALDNGELKAGDRVLVMNNSPVAAWSTMLVEI